MEEVSRAPPGACQQLPHSSIVLICRRRPGAAVGVVAVMGAGSLAPRYPSCHPTPPEQGSRLGGRLQITLINHWLFFLLSSPCTGKQATVGTHIKNCKQKASMISRDSFNNLLVWNYVTNRIELKNLSRPQFHPAISCHYPFLNHVALRTMEADILANRTGRLPFTLCKG